MRRRIWNMIGIGVLAAAIAFSLIQLRIPVVRADGCPDPSTVGCNCSLTYSLWWMENGVEHGECHYRCDCCSCGNNSDFFLIEQTYVY